MNKTIWLYWENKKGCTKPAYLDLSLETIKKHSPNYEVILLNEKTVYDYLPNLRKDLYKMVELAHKADYIRAKIMYEYGGIWLDSDIILFKEIEIEEYLEKYEYVGSSLEYGQPSIWFFGSTKGCNILKKWIDEMDKKLDAKFSVEHKAGWKENKYKYLADTLKVINPLGIKALRKSENKFRNKYNKKLAKVGAFKWSEIGYDILWKLFEGYDYHNVEFDRFAPLTYDRWEEFFKNNISPEEILKDDTISVMLYNKYMFAPLKDLTREEVLAQDNLLAKLYKLSLGIE